MTLDNPLTLVLVILLLLLVVAGFVSSVSIITTDPAERATGL